MTLTADDLGRATADAVFDTALGMEQARLLDQDEALRDMDNERRQATVLRLDRLRRRASAEQERQPRGTSGYEAEQERKVRDDKDTAQHHPRHGGSGRAAG